MERPSVPAPRRSSGALRKSVLDMKLGVEFWMTECRSRVRLNDAGADENQVGVAPYAARCELEVVGWKIVPPVLPGGLLGEDLLHAHAGDRFSASMSPRRPWPQCPRSSRSAPCPAGTRRCRPRLACSAPPRAPAPCCCGCRPRGPRCCAGRGCGCSLLRKSRLRTSLLRRSPLRIVFCGYLAAVDGAGGNAVRDAAQRDEQGDEGNNQGRRGPPAHDRLHGAGPPNGSGCEARGLRRNCGGDHFVSQNTLSGAIGARAAGGLAPGPARRSLAAGQA